MVGHLSPEARSAFTDHFAVNLARARRRAGLSQEEAGFRTGLHRTEIGQLEMGRRIPQLDTAVRLAGALGVRVDELVEGIEWVAPAVGVGRFKHAIDEPEQESGN
jgi:transcriptional regulator with XRE-family HTH domain